MLSAYSTEKKTAFWKVAFLLSSLFPRKYSDTNFGQSPPFDPPGGRTRGPQESENYCRREFLSFRRLLNFLKTIEEDQKGYPQKGYPRKGQMSPILGHFYTVVSKGNFQKSPCSWIPLLWRPFWSFPRQAKTGEMVRKRSGCLFVDLFFGPSSSGHLVRDKSLHRGFCASGTRI